MANNRYDANQIKEQKNAYLAALRANQIACDHRNGNTYTLESVDNTKEFVRNKEMYTNGFICKQCKDVFSMDSFTAADIADHLSALFSMCNQAKLLFGPSDADYEQIKSIMEFLDQIQSSFVPYYLNHIKEMTNNNRKGDNNNQNRTKGKIGVSAVAFSRG